MFTKSYHEVVESIFQRGVVMNKIVVVLIASFSGLIALSGCSTTYYHPYKSEADFYSDQNRCIAEANSVHPVRESYYTMPGSSSPALTTCHNTGYGNINCTTTGGYQSPPTRISTGDTNAISRAFYVDRCLKGLGYTTESKNIGGTGLPDTVETESIKDAWKKEDKDLSKRLEDADKKAKKICSDRLGEIRTDKWWKCYRETYQNL